MISCIVSMRFLPLYRGAGNGEGMPEPLLGDIQSGPGGNGSSPIIFGDNGGLGRGRAFRAWHDVIRKMQPYFHTSVSTAGESLLLWSLP